ncbi:aldolase [Neolentinus lepideus HHB14362 ss-1]|uniref:Aldolase n=1 Tax=Neolentinus lepideus HHB14362 ss-1 TaxID=1314782 RepID=A0A165N3Q4_9AGAM|nr:aldolase [Neolentinus lepideus HHB14362 ss-1]
MSKPPPSGIYVPAVLFFDENEEFDVPAIKAHVLRLAKGGVTGILVQGSNGEAQHLSHDERKLAIRITRQTLDENGFQNTAVIAGTGAQSTRETKKLCADAKEAGATHTLVLTPSTWPHQMTNEAIIRFHTEVANASPIPTMIYNFPTVTAGLNLDSDIIGILAEHPNIVGTKLSCGDIGKLHRLTSSVSPEKFATFPGTSAVYLQGLLTGSAGLIGALPNIAPKAHYRVYELYKEGKLEEAMKLQGVLGHADAAVSKLGGISAIKVIISKEFGYGKPVARGPLQTLSADALQSGPHLDKVKELLAIEKSLPEYGTAK